MDPGVECSKHEVFTLLQTRQATSIRSLEESYVSGTLAGPTVGQLICEKKAKEDLAWLHVKVARGEVMHRRRQVLYFATLGSNAKRLTPGC